MEELPHPVALERARPLTAGERALLDRLIEPLAHSELHEQAATAQVVATCSCGCPSVFLRTAGRALAADVMRELDDVSGPDAANVSASAYTPDGCEVEVTLHLVVGRMRELEIWPGWHGGEVQIALPAAHTLRHWRNDQ